MIDNGISLFLWVGLLVDQDWIRCVFGAESVAQIDIFETRLTDFDNPQSLKVTFFFSTYYFVFINRLFLFTGTECVGKCEGKAAEADAIDDCPSYGSIGKLLP